MAEVVRGELRLAYERVGEGPPLLLISPLGWSGAHWQLHQTVPLSEHFQVITFDHRGTGGSSTPEGPYSTRLLAHDVVTLLEEIDLVEPVRMIGLGSGGAVLQWLCLDQPEAVRAAVFVASGPGQIDARPVQRAFTEAELKALAKDWPATLREQLSGREYFVGGDRGLIDPFVAAVAGEKVTALEAYRWHAEAAFAHETTERTSEIEMPCFVLVGEQDTVAPEGSPDPIETSLELAKRLFYAEYVEIERAAHALHVEQHAAFNEAVLDFLARY